MTDYVINHLGPFDVPGLKARRVRVFVPPRQGSAPSPVLYMFDGQNIYDDEPSYSGGWYLHRTARSIWKRYGRAPVIVGIDHGGEARVDELTPWPGERGGGGTDALVDWMIGSLMPRIREDFRVAEDPAQVGIGGSSMGGLGALYAHFRNPERFGLVLSMSPSLWVGRGHIFAHITTKSKPWTSRIYLDAGALEAGGRMLESARRLAAELRARGWDDGSLRFVEAKRGTHSEKHWRRRAPGALEFLFLPESQKKPRKASR
ncbi:putative alpha-dextrin endo-1, 6-alpha-glucosidase [Minicystis rosea]|nr:putative alpha-dextrin endo-1, 6-alpha-glucosidase [Minicystis rosea]